VPFLGGYMKVIYTKAELIKEVAFLRKENHCIGFVPTMGALHTGHVSLIQESKLSCNRTIVSVFVNPTQFNNPSDLEKYPRNLDADLKKLEDSGCHCVFVPSIEEMYPTEEHKSLDGIRISFIVMVGLLDLFRCS